MATFSHHPEKDSPTISDECLAGEHEECDGAGCAHEVHQAEKTEAAKRLEKRRKKAGGGKARVVEPAREPEDEDDED